MGPYAKPFILTPHRFQQILCNLWGKGYYPYFALKTQRQYLTTKDIHVLHVFKNHSCTDDFQMYPSSLNFLELQICVSNHVLDISIWISERQLERNMSITELLSPLNVWSLWQLHLSVAQAPHFAIPSPSSDSSANTNISRMWAFLINSANTTLVLPPLSLPQITESPSNCAPFFSLGSCQSIPNTLAIAIPGKCKTYVVPLL